MARLSFQEPFWVILFLFFLVFSHQAQEKTKKSSKIFMKWMIPSCWVCPSSISCLLLDEERNLFVWDTNTEMSFWAHTRKDLSCMTFFCFWGVPLCHILDLIDRTIGSGTRRTMVTHHIWVWAWEKRSFSIRFRTVPDNKSLVYQSSWSLSG